MNRARNRVTAATKCKGKPHAMCVGHWELEDGKCAWICEEVEEEQGGTEENETGGAGKSQQLVKNSSQP